MTAGLPVMVVPAVLVVAVRPAWPERWGRTEAAAVSAVTVVPAGVVARSRVTAVPVGSAASAGSAALAVSV
ncbi:hypothetical protein [Mycolicibacterium sarraceniae]|nr:hypothetical protein [Mycolicibacterium sarraceniae]